MKKTFITVIAAIAIIGGGSVCAMQQGDGACAGAPADSTVCKMRPAGGPGGMPGGAPCDSMGQRPMMPPMQGDSMMGQRPPMPPMQGDSTMRPPMPPMQQAQ